MKKSFTTQVHADTLDRVRATVLGLRKATDDARWTLSDAAEIAFTIWCDEMEKQYNAGKPWPTSERLAPGRPISLE